MTAARIARYRKMSAFLASHSDIVLAQLLRGGRCVGVGVGGDAAVFDVDGVPVFAKRVPLTDRELAHRTTANLFDLPMLCQYGIGGPSFTAWRELAANVIVTEGVLTGVTEAFPLLYHWRVLPGRSPIAAEHADIDSVVAAFGGDSAVRTRLEALAAATSSLVLFCEYIPYSMADWLREKPAADVSAVAQQFSEIVVFLNDRELLHMDGHFGNMRSDGKKLYLSDFGLATSPLFDLSATERTFAERHATHDADYAAMRLVNWIVTDICGLPASSLGGHRLRNDYVIRCAAGDIPADVEPEVAAILRRHAPAAAKMNAFYGKLFGGDIHATYPSG